MMGDNISRNNKYKLLKKRKRCIKGAQCPRLKLNGGGSQCGVPETCIDNELVSLLTDDILGVDVPGFQQTRLLKVPNRSQHATLSFSTHAHGTTACSNRAERIRVSHLKVLLYSISHWLSDIPIWPMYLSESHHMGMCTPLCLVGPKETSLCGSIHRICPKVNVLLGWKHRYKLLEGQDLIDGHQSIQCFPV